MHDLLESCSFPLALISPDGVILCASAAWTAELDLQVGESLLSKLRLRTETKTMESWSDTKQAIQSGANRSFDIEDRPLYMVLSPGLKDRAGCFWARIDTDDLNGSYYGKVAHEKRLADMAEMTAGIAHEVSNPLTIIAAKATMISFISNRTPQASISEALGCVEQILIQCKRITKIVKAMRTFSRDAGSDPLSEASITHLIDESKALCFEKARIRGTEFVVAESPLDARVTCRPVEVTQILYNLLTNAIDATETVPHPKVEVAFRESSEHLEILVSDNGPGVKPELATKIFNPFFTTKEVGKGTGLGLSLALRMSRLNGGNLYLDSSRSASCFVLRLSRPKGKDNDHDQKAS